MRFLFSAAPSLFMAALLLVGLGAAPALAQNVKITRSAPMTATCAATTGRYCSKPRMVRPCCSTPDLQSLVRKIRACLNN